MDEYLKINWRENLLNAEEESKLTKEFLAKSRMNQFLNGELSLNEIKHSFNKDNKLCKTTVKYPGQTFIYQGSFCSKLTKEEHLRLINALKLAESGRTAFNKFELQDISFAKNVRSAVTAENQRFLTGAEKCWNAHYGRQPVEISDDVNNYATKDRLRKLQSVFKYKKYYRPIDLLPWCWAEEDINVELLHSANVLDLGSVGKYMSPLLKEACFLSKDYLTTVHNSNFQSTLSISQDENISDYIQSGNVDIAISISALKCLMDYQSITENWIIPLQIKNIKLDDNRSKKIIYFDKPLPKLTATKEDLNERCHKLLIRSNFCNHEGFSYSTNGKLIDETKEYPSSEPNAPKIIHNVSYKLWTLQPEHEMNAPMLKSRNKHTSAFRILVRTKLDACESINNVLMPVTVVPKLEYQLNYGGRCSTRSELVRNWTDLQFRPGSVLHRIRTHYKSSEVVKIDTFNLQKLLGEAYQHYSYKAQHSLSVIYKLLTALNSHSKEGCYLLRHEPKNGGFVALLKDESESDSVCLDGFDLHLHYSKASIMESFYKKWTKIDVGCLLPEYERRGHCPGLFKPINGRFQQQRGKKKKAKKKKNKKKQVVNNKETAD